MIQMQSSVVQRTTFRMGFPAANLHSFVMPCHEAGKLVVRACNHTRSATQAKQAHKHTPLARVYFCPETKTPLENCKRLTGLLQEKQRVASQSHDVIPLHMLRLCICRCRVGSQTKQAHNHEHLLTLSTLLGGFSDQAATQS